MPQCSPLPAQNSVSATGDLRADLEASALVAAWTGGEAAGRDERIARVASRLGDAAGPVRARALSTMTWIAATEGRDAARVRELAGEMVALSAARETGDPAAIMASLMAIAALGAVDEHDSAWAAIELMQAHAEEHAPYARPIVAALAMFHLWRRGHYAEALTYESPVAPLGPGHLAIAPLAAVLVESDRLDEAGRLTPSREPVDTSAPLPLGWELVEFARGRRHSERGEHAEAAAAFELAGQLHLRHGIQGSSLISWRSQAGLALLRAGDADRGARLILDEVEVAERYGAKGSIGIARAAEGVLRGGEAGVALLAQAEELLAEAGLEGERANAIYELGALTRRLGRGREAREHLRRALDLASSIGALALARHCRAELAAPAPGRAAPRSAARIH